MTPARRNCRARSRTRICYSTPFIDSSFAVASRHRAIRVRCGVAPRRPGARLLWGWQRRLGAIPGTTAAAWLRWWLPKWRLRFRHCTSKDGRTSLLRV